MTSSDDVRMTSSDDVRMTSSDDVRMTSSKVSGAWQRMRYLSACRGDWISRFSSLEAKKHICGVGFVR
ncbi:hypothetical protein SO802_024837 [Lithocarpus litseifolius]|uniref:Uncharacterized protein n=1 Tax=Lithocarpus litseifolius TaxID=425828 RepID=A0AAW2CDZ9_9ROSI